MEPSPTSNAGAHHARAEVHRGDQSRLHAAAGISSHGVWRIVAFPHTPAHTATFASFYDFLSSELAVAAS